MNQSDRINEHQLMFLRDCRQRIYSARLRGDRIDGRRPLSPDKYFSPTASLLRAAMTHAEKEGYSGEDTMTLIAWEALKQVETLHDALYLQMALQPAAQHMLVQMLSCEPPVDDKKGPADERR